MARKVYVNVVTRLIINAEEDLSVNEIVCDMDYNFKSQTKGAEIVDTEIVDYTVTDSK